MAGIARKPMTTILWCDDPGGWLVGRCDSGNTRYEIHRLQPGAYSLFYIDGAAGSASRGPVVPLAPRASWWKRIIAGRQEVSDAVRAAALAEAQRLCQWHQDHGGHWPTGREAMPDSESR